jgi:hypothetical protein
MDNRAIVFSWQERQEADLLSRIVKGFVDKR